MRRGFGRGFLPLYVTLVFSLICLKSHAQSNMVYLISPSGDYIGQGATYYTTNAADIGMSGSLQTVTVSAFGYGIQFDAPDSSDLTVGVYTNASRYPFNGSQPGLTVSGNGRGCNTASGQFEIHEIHTNSNGQVDHFWATFSHSCEGFMPAMTGDVRYNSLLAPTQPVGQIRRVPADYATIQAAIDAANVVGDTVLVNAGTYPEAIQFKGKSVHVISVTGAVQTIIRAPSGSAAVSFVSGETTDAIICGFTITNGSPGVSVSGASGTILSNTIVGCSGGINCNFASPIIRSNRIVTNNGDAIHLGGAAAAVVDGNVIDRNTGGGVTLFAAGTPTITNNVIRNNLGNGIDMSNYSDANIIQNVIANNAGAGIYWLVPSGNRGPFVIQNTIVGNLSAGISADGYDAQARVINNVLAGNPALNVGSFNDNNPPIVQYNDVYSTNGQAYAGLISNLTGVNGNISAEPIFLDPQGRDYRLRKNSPGIDVGTTNQTTPVDLEGNIRPTDGDGVPPALPDMGAHEFVPGPPRPATTLHAVSTVPAVLLDWKAFDDATSYVLGRSTNGAGPFPPIASITSTNFADSNAVAGVVYFYVVAGQNGFGIGSNSAPVSIRAGNHPPVASNDTVTINEDTATVISILANDSDADGDALVAQLLSQPQNGQATMTGTNVTYQPQLNFNGTNSFTYKITDTLGSSATGLVTVIVLPVNDPPTANNASFSQPADTISTNTLTGADVDSSNLVFIISSSASHGVATLNPTTAKLIYRPVHGFFGADSLRFQVFDGQANSAEATVSINVSAPTDVDHDGMADAWENLWDLNDPNADPDHDGFTSLQEYLANTSPRDPKSFFHIMSEVPDTNGFWHITWASVGGTRYRVYSTDSLSGGATYQPIIRSTDVEMDPAAYGVASTQTYIDLRPPPITGARFYRIAVVQ